MKIEHDSIVGGCKICDQDFRTHRNLLLHLQQHCGDIFYLIERSRSSSPDVILNENEILINDGADDASVTTPEPTQSPVEHEIEPENLPNDKKLKLIENYPKKFLNIFPENKSSAAKRPTMVRLAEASDNLNYFTCSECSQTFDNAEFYKDHLNIHLNVAGASTSSRNESNVEIYQDFKCIDCDRSFADVNQYHDHLKMSHGVETLSCAVCEQQFGTKFELNRHMGAHNGGSYECPDCGSCFRIKKLLEKHIFDHSSSTNCSSSDDHGANSSTESIRSTTIGRSTPPVEHRSLDDWIDSQADACTSNGYLDELLAFTVTNRPKRMRLSRPPPNANLSKSDHSGQNSCRSSPRNAQETESFRDKFKFDDAGKLLGNYFLDLVQTNVCKYKHKQVSNFGAFNYYLSNCMDTASVDKSTNNNHQTTKRKSLEET